MNKTPRDVPSPGDGGNGYCLKDWVDLYNLSVDSFNRKDYKESLCYCNQMLKINQADIVALSLIGVNLSQVVGREQEALQRFKEVIGRNPEKHPFYKDYEDVINQSYHNAKEWYKRMREKPVLEYVSVVKWLEERLDIKLPTPELEDIVHPKLKSPLLNNIDVTKVRERTKHYIEKLHDIVHNYMSYNKELIARLREKHSLSSELRHYIDSDEVGIMETYKIRKIKEKYSSLIMSNQIMEGKYKHTKAEYGEKFFLLRLFSKEPEPYEYITGPSSCELRKMEGFIKGLELEMEGIESLCCKRKDPIIYLNKTLEEVVKSYETGTVEVNKRCQLWGEYHLELVGALAKIQDRAGEELFKREDLESILKPILEDRVSPPMLFREHKDIIKKIVPPFLYIKILKDDCRRKLDMDAAGDISEKFKESNPTIKALVELRYKTIISYRIFYNMLIEARKLRDSMEARNIEEDDRKIRNLDHQLKKLREIWILDSEAGEETNMHTAAGSKW